MVKPKAHVDEVKCLSCGACVSVCPQDAILITAGKARVNKNICSSCYICVKTCPVAAISEGEA